MTELKLTHIKMAVKLRPPQSHRLKSRKQLTGMKYWSVNQTIIWMFACISRTRKRKRGQIHADKHGTKHHRRRKVNISRHFNRKRGIDRPQEPPSLSVDLVSAVTAGNVPMVTVKVKQTDRAKIQIWGPKVRGQTFPLKNKLQLILIIDCFLIS